jgi:hypothetical protein
MNCNQSAMAGFAPTRGSSVRSEIVKNTNKTGSKYFPIPLAYTQPLVYIRDMKNKTIERPIGTSDLGAAARFNSPSEAAQIVETLKFKFGFRDAAVEDSGIMPRPWVVRFGGELLDSVTFSS